MGKAIFEGDRIKLILRQPYTEEDIRMAGCHPGVDGKTGKVIRIEEGAINRMFHIKLDKKLHPHKLHVNTEYNEMFDDYCETEENIELYDGEDNVKTNYVFLKPININAYRRPNCDIPAITGLYHTEPDGLPGRLCYEVTYEDGFVDYVPKSDVDNGDYVFVVQ